MKPLDTERSEERKSCCIWATCAIYRKLQRGRSTRIRNRFPRFFGKQNSTCHASHTKISFWIFITTKTFTNQFNIISNACRIGPRKPFCQPSLQLGLHFDFLYSQNTCPNIGVQTNLCVTLMKRQVYLDGSANQKNDSKKQLSRKNNMVSQISVHSFPPSNDSTFEAPSNMGCTASKANVCHDMFHLWSLCFGPFVTWYIFQTHLTKSDYPTVSFTFWKETDIVITKLENIFKIQGVNIAQKGSNLPPQQKLHAVLVGWRFLFPSERPHKIQQKPSDSPTRSGSDVTNRRRLVLGVLGAKLTAEKWSIHAVATKAAQKKTVPLKKRFLTFRCLR